MSEPRQWFLYESVSEDVDTLTAVPRGNDPYDQYANMITVIEKFAYDQLLAKLKVYEEALAERDKLLEEICIFLDELNHGNKKYEGKRNWAREQMIDKIKQAKGMK
jgi:hypothetical protein